MHVGSVCSWRVFDGSDKERLSRPKLLVVQSMDAAAAIAGRARERGKRADARGWQWKEWTGLVSDGDPQPNRLAGEVAGAATIAREAGCTYWNAVNGHAFAVQHANRRKSSDGKAGNSTAPGQRAASSVGAEWLLVGVVVVVVGVGARGGAIGRLAAAGTRLQRGAGDARGSSSSASTFNCCRGRWWEKRERAVPSAALGQRKRSVEGPRAGDGMVAGQSNQRPPFHPVPAVEFR